MISPWYGFPNQSGAEFSVNREHRFLLWRLWSPPPGKLLGFVMLNPSTADETRDDPTTVRNMARARALGYAGVVQANLYTFRTPSPKVLKQAGFPGGFGLCANRDALRSLGDVCEDVVLAWGAHAPVGDVIDFMQQAQDGAFGSIRLLHLGRTKNGMPRHPLHTAYAVPLQEWR